MNCIRGSREDSEDILLQDLDVSRTKHRKCHDVDDKHSDPVTCNGYEDISGVNGTDNIGDKTTWRDSSICGYAMCILSNMTIAVGLACTQALAQTVPHSELNGFRFTAQLIVISPFLLGFKKCDVTVEKKQIVWLCICAFIMSANSYAQYGAVYYLPLGVSSGVSRSLAVIFTYVISSINNKEFCWYKSVAVIVCVSGVVLVIQPSFIFHNKTGTSFLNPNQTYGSPCSLVATNDSTIHEVLYSGIESRSKEYVQTVVGYVLCVAAAVTSTAYIQVIRRKLTDLNIFVYNFWACLFGISSSFCIMAATETPYFPTIAICILFLLIHMFTAGSHAIFAYRAYQLLDPLVASLVNTLQIGAAFVLQYTVLYGLYPGNANALEVTGAVLILFGNALVPLHQLIKTSYNKQISK